MHIDILERHFIICSMIFRYHNKVFVSLRQMEQQVSTDKELRKTIVKNTAKILSTGVVANFVSKCTEIGLSSKRYWNWVSKREE